jgi:hypothetical protein
LVTGLATLLEWEGLALVAQDWERLAWEVAREEG